MFTYKNYDRIKLTMLNVLVICYYISSISVDPKQKSISYYMDPLESISVDFVTHAKHGGKRNMSRNL